MDSSWQDPLLGTNERATYFYPHSLKSSNEMIIFKKWGPYNGNQQFFFGLFYNQ